MKWSVVLSYGPLNHSRYRIRWHCSAFLIDLHSTSCCPIVSRELRAYHWAYFHYSLQHVLASGGAKNLVFKRCSEHFTREDLHLNPKARLNWNLHVEVISMPFHPCRLFPGDVRFLRWKPNWSEIDAHQSAINFGHGVLGRNGTDSNGRRWPTNVLSAAGIRGSRRRKSALRRRGLIFAACGLFMASAPSSRRRTCA